MAFHWHPGEQIAIGRFLAKWTFLASLAGVAGGVASAIFLISLDLATDTRLAFPWLFYFIPLGGLIVGLLYYFLGKEVEKGNNLLLEEIHNPRNGIPLKMSPLILATTVITHLFGGSAGREGTAVQMGGSLASALARFFNLDPRQSGILLMAGMSAGFGAVFGTPLAGMIFGLELLSVGHLRYDALIPCLIASTIGDLTCQTLGVHHGHYEVATIPTMNLFLLGKVLLASIAFALASLMFGELTHGFQWLFSRLIPWKPIRPFVGGIFLILLTAIAGTRDYLGLGLPMIYHAFSPEGVPPQAFALKILFTALTLGSGFKGGEVTPLFFVGATLGSALAVPLGLPHDMMAAVGFAAVFAGASNTPLASTIMGIELFGSPLAIYLALACCSSYVWSGHRGIYLSQKIVTPKSDSSLIPAETTLDHLRKSLNNISHSEFRGKNTFIDSGDDRNFQQDNGRQG